MSAMSAMSSEDRALSSEAVLQQVKLSLQLPSVLEAIATRAAIEKAASAAGIQVEIAELQEAADAFRLAHRLQRSEDAWQWMEQHGLSLDEFEEMLRFNILTAKLSNHLFANKIEPLFVDRQLDYAQAIAYEVVFEDEDLAMELFYAIQEGELNFFQVGREYIQDRELRRTGGYRKPLRRSDLRPEISAAVFAAKPPQLLKPIVTSNGAHLIFVEELIEPELDRALTTQILAELFAAWLKQQVSS
ncbi:peptidylprolyl isomerase [Pseudanabaena sp. PCC 6802]|uniref:peptidylprolyl isomerase n=1 Tax=Pseudanabaena sp. PCC 6802 TaxID=118173 RepID=UPI000346BAD3|nr:peptidylprolyl isomerase [Pseudanabaena sp. PCC 6802]